MQAFRSCAVLTSSLLVAAVCGGPGTAHAAPQHPGAQAGKPDPDKAITLPEAPAQSASACLTDRPSARDAAQKVLDDRHWSEGYDTERDWGIWIGTATISGPDVNHRASAIEEAMLDAKWEFAKYLGSKIASASAKLMEQHPDQRAAQMAELKKRAAGGDSNAQDMLNALSAAGDDASRPGAPAPSNAQWRKRMEQASATIAQNAVSGMIVYQSFERAGKGDDDGEVAVIMMTTPKTRAVAEALLGRPNKAALTGERKDRIVDWVKGMSDNELAYTFGAKTRLNENGELCVIGFGHAVPGGPEREWEMAAATKADEEADVAIRKLAGSMIQGVVAMSKVSDKTKLADGSLRSESKDSMKQKIDEAANWLTLLGSSRVMAPKVVRANPRYADVVVVKEWNVTKAIKAGEIAAGIKQSGGFKGGDGLGADGKGGTPAPAQKPKRGSDAVRGDGKKSDDDDQ
jgi:cytochrome c5